MAKTQKIWIAILVVVIVAVVGSRVYKRQEGNSGTIRIGAIFMLSGVGADWGENSQKGASLAVEEINKSGGVDGRPLEMVYQDNMGDNPAEALSAFHKFVDIDGIKIILGPNWTPSGLALAPVACQNKVLMISPTLGVKDFNEACDYLFNLWAHDESISRALGEWLYQKGYRNIAILGSNQEWEQVQAEAVRDSFTGAGGTIVDYELAQKGQQDFRSEVLKIKRSHPDAVVFTNFTYQQFSAIEMRDLDQKLSFFSVLLDNDQIKAGHGAFEGTVVITSFAPTSDFVNKFTGKYGTKPDAGSDTSYDSVMLIAQAITATHSTDSGTLKDYIGALKEYDGASGHLVFDGKRGVTKDPKYMMVKNGGLVPFE